MAKLPFWQVYVKDILVDIAPLSLAASGAWCKTLLLMRKAQPITGIIDHTVEEWCQILHCTDAQFRTVLVEFRTFDICIIEAFSGPIPVDFRSDSGLIPDRFRLISRRIVREESARVRDAERKRKQREDDKLRKQVMKRPPVVQAPSNESPRDTAYIHTADIHNPPVTPPSVSPSAHHCEEAWKALPSRDGKKLYKQQFREFYEEHIKPEERGIFLAACKEYRRHCDTADRTPVDPHRFISGQKGELWRDFIKTEPEPQKKTHTNGSGATIVEDAMQVPAPAPIVKGAPREAAFCLPPPEVAEKLERFLGGGKLFGQPEKLSTPLASTGEFD